MKEFTGALWKKDNSVGSFYLLSENYNEHKIIHVVLLRKI